MSHIFCGFMYKKCMWEVVNGTSGVLIPVNEFIYLFHIFNVLEDMHFIWFSM